MPVTNYRNKYPAKGRSQVLQMPGRMMKVGDCLLHCYISSPNNDNNYKVAEVSSDKSQLTIVIEAGCGCHSAVYYWLQKSLSKSFQVMSYDRAGLGWSDNHHHPRDAEYVAIQLSRLLSKAGINGPILLLGHSIGGLYLRVYANLYPDNIVGMVLLDSSHPKVTDVLPLTGTHWQHRLHNYFMSVFSSLGLSCYFRQQWIQKYLQTQYLPEFIQQQIFHVFRLKQSYLTGLNEMDAYELVASQVLQAEPLGDMPLLIITASELNHHIPLPKRQSHLDAWLYLQQDLLTLSSCSRQVIVEGAGHTTLVTKKEYADQVCDEILRLVRNIKSPVDKIIITPAAKEID